MTAPDIPQRLSYSHTIGIVAMEGRGFSNPVDVAISSADRVYVVSRTNPDQPYGIRVGICDMAGDDYFGDFGDYGDGDGAFVWPTALAFDEEDNLYLADEYNHRITVFDASGRFLSRWGERGSEPGRLNGPSGVCPTPDGDLLVVDHLNNRVQRFTKGGELVACWGERGGGVGQLDLPWGVAVDGSGAVYVADWRNDRIQKFTPEGELLASFGNSGDGPGELHRPSGVAVDGDGYIYVADWGNERVQALAPDGEPVQVLKGESTLSKWAEEFYEANPDEWEARQASEIEPELDPAVDTAYEASARIEPHFWAPVSVKLDRYGRLYVVESNRHRIQVYETT